MSKIVEKIKNSQKRDNKWICFIEEDKTRRDLKTGRRNKKNINEKERK